MPNPLLYGLDCHGLVVQQSCSSVVGYTEIVVIKTVIIVASISQTISFVCKCLMRLFNDPFPHLVCSLTHFLLLHKIVRQVHLLDIVGTKSPLFFRAHEPLLTQQWWLHYLCIGTQSMEQLRYGCILSWRISSKCENALDFGSRWLHLQILSCVCPWMLSRPDIIRCDRIKINANEVFTRNGSHEILLKQSLSQVRLQGQSHDIGTIEHLFLDLPDRFGTSIEILFGSFVIQKKKITVNDSTKQGELTVIIMDWLFKRHLALLLHYGLVIQEHVDDSDRLSTFIFGSLTRPPEAHCVFRFMPLTFT